MGNIEDIEIKDTLESAYMAYAMAVNLGRAIPDLRDGFKPVQRRVILGLINLTAGTEKFVKSARVVGEVMGKYHPHGDSSIYEAAISMSTDWGNRLPLITPQGNNGSISGDNPAAMRYTEMRLSRFININKHMLANSGVPLIPTYDGSDEEYTLFPTDIPYVLVNGTRGIGVAMSSYIPPFNPKDITRGCEYILDRWVKDKKPTIKGIARLIKGPDFPTGGLVSSPDWVKILETGKGKLTHEVSLTVKDNTLTINSIPTETTVTQLLRSISNKAKELGLKDISDLTDGRGVTIELVFKKPVTEDTIELLHKLTISRVNKTVRMVVCYRDEVKTMSVLEILEKWLKNRDTNYLSMIVNAHSVLLDNIHNLNLMVFMAENIDTIIEIIHNSKTTEEARETLMVKLEVSEYDADKIIAVRLKQVRSLDIISRKEEVKSLKKEVKVLEKKMVDNKSRYRDIIDSMYKLIEDNDGRLTKVKEYSNIDIKGNTNVVAHLDRNSIYVREATSKDENIGFNHILKGDTHILILTSDGVVYRIPVHKISSDPGSPMRYIRPRERNVHITHVCVYKDNMSLKVSLYNSSKLQHIPLNLTIGKGGNKLFDLPTNVIRVTAKYAKH